MEEDRVSVEPETRQAATRAADEPKRPPRRLSPRALALLVTLAFVTTLGVGALADTLAVAPLRPPTQTAASRQAGLYIVTLTISPEPLTAGAETAFTVRVTDTTGEPVRGARVTCDYTMPAMPMPQMLITASEETAGVYACHETLTDPGGWALAISVTPPSAEAVRASFALQAR